MTTATHSDSGPRSGSQRLTPDELRTLFLFEKLTDEQLEWLAARGEVRTYHGGVPVYEESDPADYLYVLLSGGLRMSRSVQGEDLTPVLADTSATVRDHILFAQDSAQTTGLNQVRYALRGFYDGRTKYARYYGVGGGKPSTGHG